MGDGRRVLNGDSLVWEDEMSWRWQVKSKVWFGTYLIYASGAVDYAAGFRNLKVRDDDGLMLCGDCQDVGGTRCCVTAEPPRK